jgi:hypothetical protein
MPFEDLTKIRALFFCTSTGSKIAGQYYDTFIKPEKRADFEQSLFDRVREETKGEVLQYDQYIVLFKATADLLMIVVGDLKSNELIFAQLLHSLESALGLIFRKPCVDACLSQIENVYLLLDETIEQGYILEGNPEVLAARVTLKEDNAFAGKVPIPMSF